MSDICSIVSGVVPKSITGEETFVPINIDSDDGGDIIVYRN